MAWRESRITTWWLCVWILRGLDYDLEVVFGLEGLPITTWRLYVWKVFWLARPDRTSELYVSDLG